MAPVGVSGGVVTKRIRDSLNPGDFVGVFVDMPLDVPADLSWPGGGGGGANLAGRFDKLTVDVIDEQTLASSPWVFDKSWSS